MEIKRYFNVCTILLDIVLKKIKVIFYKIILKNLYWLNINFFLCNSLMILKLNNLNLFNKEFDLFIFSKTIILIGNFS